MSIDIESAKDPVTHGATPTENGEPPRFDWPLAHEAEALLRGYQAAFLAENSFAQKLATRMREESGTDFFEWIDHLVVGPSELPALTQAGFELDPSAETPRGEKVYEHPRATLPR